MNYKRVQLCDTIGMKGKARRDQNYELISKVLRTCCPLAVKQLITAEMCNYYGIPFPRK